MTFGRFYRLYQAYKDDFDLELAMKTKGIRYKDLEEKVQEREEIIAF